MDEPGSLSGIIISPIPLRGPELNIRISLPTFMKATAARFNAPDNSTIASCAARASNLFGAVTNGKPVSSAIFLATKTSYPLGVFSPVPTAVPPKANSRTASSAFLIARMLLSICCTYPENSCPNVSGVASIKCVLPVLTMALYSVDFFASVSREGVLTRNLVMS